MSVILLIFSSLQFIFNFQSGDIFGCLADLGWIAGHTSVVYGPLCNGATTVLFEGVATYPNCGTLHCIYNTACAYVLIHNSVVLQGPSKFLCSYIVLIQRSDISLVLGWSCNFLNFKRASKSTSNLLFDFNISFDVLLINRLGQCFPSFSCHKLEYIFSFSLVN